MDESELRQAAEYELLLVRLDSIDGRLEELEAKVDYVATASAWLVRSVERFTTAAEAHPVAGRFLRRG